MKEHYNMEHQPENNMDIHDIYHIQTMPIEDINLINMKIKLLKKKARKTKNVVENIFNITILEFKFKCYSARKLFLHNPSTRFKLFDK